MKRSVTVVAMALVCVLGFMGFSYLSKQLDKPEGFDPYTIPDAVEYTAGIPRDTVMFTVDGQPVTAEVYLYWASYFTEMVQYYEFQGGELDWAVAREDGKSLSDYIKEESLSTAQLYRIVATKAEELGCGLTDQNQADYKQALNQAIEKQGGEVEFDKWLLQVGLSRDGYATLNQSALMLQNLQTKMNPGPASDQEVADYVTANDLLRAKHILIMTKDQATGQPLGEEAKAAAKAQAEDILAQLQASTDLETDFDRLMQEFSQDAGLATNPDGYTFTAGQMVVPFETGTRALEYGQMSDLVESDFGYHIILRLDPATEEMAVTLGQQAGEKELDAMITKWMEEAVVETTPAYDALDMATAFGNLTSLRAEIEAADQAAAQPSESPSPSPSPAA